MPNHKHLFAIDSDVMFSISMEEVEATKAGLIEAGLYAMPFDRDVYIELNTLVCVGPDADPAHSMIYGPFGDGQTVQIALHDSRRNHITDKGSAFEAPSAIEQMRSILIVLLATRNAVKQTTENKLARMGIGKSPRNRFVSTTTISLPRNMDVDTDNPPKGGHVAPHLRRGHVRKQPYGKERKLDKVIWIAPIFVNADPGFVATRTRYRIKA